MISYLKGKIKYVGSNWLILDVNDVGYKVFISKPYTSKPYNSTPLCLYTYHQIREDRSDLYGFETIEELNVFELLLEVNGVGPKMAMNILSGAKVENIKNAIIGGDATFFVAISGVGKKLASKILLELKNKLGDSDYNILENSEASTELLDAMQSLGYQKSEIYKLISKIPKDLKSTQDKVKWMLKNKK
jgi:Holliday junction DNA helicase RuvA